jgi:hypothetical protein
MREKAWFGGATPSPQLLNCARVLLSPLPHTSVLHRLTHATLRRTATLACCHTVARSNLAALYRDHGELDKAQELFQRTLLVHTKV